MHFEIEKRPMVRCVLDFTDPTRCQHNDGRRHHIPTMSLQVQNWPQYEAGLRRRGSLTLWIEDAVLDRWQSVGPHGQARDRDIAIETCLMLRSTNAIRLPTLSYGFYGISPKRWT